MNTLASFGIIWLDKSYRSRRCVTPRALTPSNGSPTAVIINPIMAGYRLLPDCCPSISGKIKFPAPKNSPNSIEPIVNSCLNVSFCCILTPHPSKNSYLKVYSNLDTCKITFGWELSRDVNNGWVFSENGCLIVSKDSLVARFKNEIFLCGDVFVNFVVFVYKIVLVTGRNWLWGCWNLRVIVWWMDFELMWCEIRFRNYVNSSLGWLMVELFGILWMDLVFKTDRMSSIS